MHDCRKLKRLKFQILGSNWVNNYPTIIGIYDSRSHTYIWDIQYCPFCGEKL